MKQLLFNLLFVTFSIALTAQTPNYNIVVTQPTNSDTLLMDLQGVISGPLPPPASPLPDVTSQLQDIGITSIRNNGNYDDKLAMAALYRCPGCHPNPAWVPSWCCDPSALGSLHFTASDSLYRAIINGGFDLFFRIGDEVQSGLPYQHHIYHGPQDSAEENRWIQAAIAVVEHYDNFEGVPNQLEYLDIGTEWPNSLFFDRPAPKFISFFTRVLDTLKAHFPDKKVGGPGFLVPTQFVINGNVNNKATNLLTSLYQHNIKPDFISWHLWSTKPERYYLAGENFRKLLNGEYPFESVPWANTNFSVGLKLFVVLGELLKWKMAFLYRKTKNTNFIINKKVLRF